MLPSEFIVRRFWELMASNDFFSVAEVLASDFVLDWPQSGERIRGADRFARMNTEYPAHGPWTFRIDRLVADENGAVTDTRVTDGVVVGRAITFFTIEHNRISKMIEFWPEPFEPRPERRLLVERGEEPT